MWESVWLGRRVYENLRYYVSVNKDMWKFVCRSMFRFLVCVQLRVSVDVIVPECWFLAHLQFVPLNLCVTIFVNVCEYVFFYGYVDMLLWAKASIWLSAWGPLSVTLFENVWVSGCVVMSEIKIVFVYEREFEYDQIRKYVRMRVRKNVCGQEECVCVSL